MKVLGANPQETRPFENMLGGTVRTSGFRCLRECCFFGKMGMRLLKFIA